jgi:twin BRCT domain
MPSRTSRNAFHSMDGYVKRIKSSYDPTKFRKHPYKSRDDLLKEKCTAPRAIGNIFNSSITGHQVSDKARRTSYFGSRNAKLAEQFNQPGASEADGEQDRQQAHQPEIFRNCCVHINGYMDSRVSDLELKKRLASHGAQVVANFGRRSVTHVILGPNGLAAGKIQHEMLSRKTGVKFVTVDWYDVI